MSVKKENESGLLNHAEFRVGEWSQHLHLI